MSPVATAILIFVIGLAFGATCGYFKLPIPAPPTVTGVIGILGVTLGFIIMAKVIAKGWL